MKQQVSLEDIYKEISNKKLSKSLIRNSIIAFFIALAILFPKIYLSSKIYMLSIKLDKLLNSYYTLKAENAILKSKIEKLKFENRVEKLKF